MDLRSWHLRTCLVPFLLWPKQLQDLSGALFRILMFELFGAVSLMPSMKPSMLLFWQMLQTLVPECWPSPLRSPMLGIGWMLSLSQLLAFIFRIMSFACAWSTGWVIILFFSSLLFLCVWVISFVFCLLCIVTALPSSLFACLFIFFLLGLPCTAYLSIFALIILSC